MVKPLVLASTSRYREMLLRRFGLRFEQVSPFVVETPAPGEKPADTALRLAQEKAMSVTPSFRDALIIGCDQVADMNGEPIGKPLSHSVALAQLKRLRGQSVTFHTALALLNAQSTNLQLAVVSTRVAFLDLSDAELDRYLRIEQPYDCAGSAKVEGLGIALVSEIESVDPTALIGLPLIALAAMLRNEGVSPILDGYA